jgi:alcohol dehydrogenase
MSSFLFDFDSARPTTIPGSAVPVLMGRGALDRVGARATALGAKRALLVTDPGIVAAGHVARAVESLREAGIDVHVFDRVEENPTTICVDDAVSVACDYRPDLLIGLGGGSSMDCAKGCNFIYTNGGPMQRYWGLGKAQKPMLPLVAIPTTAGTGSEAQSFALITDPETHQKMACGDKRALPALAILDADLTATQPPKVAAATGIDAVAHAVETAGCMSRNEISLRLSVEAWKLLNSSFASAMSNPEDVAARQNMQLGAHLAGAAIENSMLGAAHAAANPLTAKFGITHGVAVGLMLPHVVAFNSKPPRENPYSPIASAENLVGRIEMMLRIGSLPTHLSDLGITSADLPELGAIASQQWTAKYNPVPLAAGDLVQIYQAAM